MDKNDNIVMISKDIRANERYIRERLVDCGDIQIRKMRLGDERKVDCLMVYIEVATSNMMLEDSAIGKMVGHFWEISPGEMQEFVEYNSLGIADVKKLTDMEQVFAGLLAGNAVFFMDGFDQAMKISSAGYPSMGVTEVEMEKVLRRMPNAEGVESTKVLELNPNHTVFAALKAAHAAGDTDKVAKYAELLYDQALLIAGLPIEDPVAYAQLVCGLMQ